MSKESKKAVAAPAYAEFLPFSEAPQPEVRMVGTEQTGRLAVPLYGGLSVGEAKSIQRLATRMGSESGLSDAEVADALASGVSAEGEKAVEFAVELAHIILVNRLNPRITREQTEGLPMVLLMELAQLLMAEANATGKDAESGEAGKEKTTA